MKAIVKINNEFFTAEFGSAFIGTGGTWCRPFGIGRRASAVEVAALKDRERDAPEHTSWCVIPAWSRRDGSFIGNERISSLPSSERLAKC